MAKFHRIQTTFCLFALGVQLAQAAPNQPANPANVAAPHALSANQQIEHALNRLAFGARPGDVEQVRQIGLQRWIEQQLAPSTIDDSAVEAKLARLSMLQASPDRLLLAYMSDSVNFIKKARQAAEAEDKGKEPKKEMPELKPGQRLLLETIEKAGVAPGESVQAVGELNAAKLTRAVESNHQLQEVLTDFWSNHFNVDVRKNSVRALKIVEDRDVIRPRVLGKFRDLLGASAKSPAMLVYLDNFQSTREFDPAQMTRFLRQNANIKRKVRGGLNENYARELMELHTLGVDGGYTQKDVQEVARCLTGWTLDAQRGTFKYNSGGFKFNPILHDNGEKIVLGHHIPAGGGIRDGEMVLDILASQPATAKFIARKLCVRFVADNPPQPLIDRVAQTFQNTGGDLKLVMRDLISAPEFWASDAYRGKIKSPFEYAVSAVRGLGGSVQIPDTSAQIGRLQLMAGGASSLRDGGAKKMGKRAGGRSNLAMQIAEMGQPLWAHQAPNGYPENSSEWVSSGALIARLNYALALTGGEVFDVQAVPSKLLDGVNSDDAHAVLDRLLQKLLGGQVSDNTRATLTKELPKPGTPVNPARLCALILGAPEFQRH